MLLNFNELIRDYNLKLNGIVHIGAHYGLEYDIYEQNNIQNIIFFEPVKETFEILSNRIKNENVILCNTALGNYNGKAIMNIEKANEGQSSSILKPKKHLDLFPGITFDWTEEVNIIKLDDYNFDRSKYNMINIDVQGYEMEVFKGGINFIKDYVDCINTEVNGSEVYENCCLVSELDNFLGDFDFKRVKTFWWGGKEDWGDAFYIKNK